jgi:hypothetical protein
MTIEELYEARAQLHNEESRIEQKLADVRKQIGEHNEAISELLLTAHGLERGMEYVFREGTTQFNDGVPLFIDGMVRLHDGIHVILTDKIDGYTPFNMPIVSSAEDGEIGLRVWVSLELVKENENV